MRKMNEYNRASVVARVTKDRVRSPSEKFATLSLTSYPQLEAPHCTAAHLGRRLGTAQSASTMGELKATCKRRCCHKLVIGNWNISSLTRKKHEALE